MKPPRPTWAEIDLSATRHNIRRICEIVGPRVKVLSMVKAEAYGHGMQAIAAAAIEAGASALGFATLSEALTVHAGGLKAPLIVLGWTPDWLAEEAVGHDIICTVFDRGTAAAFARAARSIGKPAHVHVKVDTGMGRLGLLPDEAPEVIAQIAAMEGIAIDGVFTHFAKADEADRSYTLAQIETFRHVLGQVEAKGIKIPVKHACNSPGILQYPEAHFDMVRPGVIQHGLDPSDDVPCPGDFQPTMSVKSMIASVKTLPPGSRVSYGGTYVTRGYERIAVLPIGYADGFRRMPNNWGNVLVHGRRANIVGRVTMDQAMVNVTDIADVRQGDEVVLIGAQGHDRIRAEDVARKLGTNNYEVTSMLMARVPRVHVD